MKTCIERWIAALAIAVLSSVAHAASWPQPPLPDNTDTVDVAQHIVFNGMDMHAQVFRSQQSQAGVVAFYRRLWSGEVVVNPMGSAQVVGHLQGDYYVTVQVSAFGNGSKGNIGVLDVATVPKHFERGKGIPRPMGSTVFNDISYPDDATPARTVALRNALSTRQNASYYRERLGADGWKPAEADACTGDTCVMRYERGDSKLTLVLSPRDGQSQVMINLLNP